MKLAAVFSIITTLFLTVLVLPASASLVSVTNQGEVVWKVLGANDSVTLTDVKKADVEVKKIADSSSPDSSISLKKDSDKMLLAVNGKETMDVTSWGSDVVELEERGDTKKISISVSDGSFIIDQEGVRARTDAGIRIDPKESGLSIATSKGSSYLSILPLDAVETVLRSKFATSVDKSGLEIKEDSDGNLAYNIAGERNLKILNVIDINVPVNTHISTTTGEVLKVDQPKWLSIFGFLFS